MRSDEYRPFDARRPASIRTTDKGQLEAQRVLLVEDDPGLQEAFALMFELQGCAVLRASDGREALELFGMRPDLIVTDYMLPYMNGVELIKHVRANAGLANIPILLMSASLPQYVDRSIADAFLPKPIGMAQLLEVSADLVHRQAD